AQWDNLAITRATDFVPPAASGSGANLRPVVWLDSPADGANLVLQNPGTLTLSAGAQDFDGQVSRVEFYAGTNKLGEITNSPYSLVWTNPMSGPFALTAAATDNSGARTVSAPVNVTLSVPAELPQLRITLVATNVLVSWPTSATAVALFSVSNLASTLN